MKGLPAWQYPLALPACAIERNLFPQDESHLCFVARAAPPRAAAARALDRSRRARAPPRDGGCIRAVELKEKSDSEGAGAGLVQPFNRG